MTVVDMENVLRCNSLKCRKELGDRALVTTCSHIFCIDCASAFGLTEQAGREPCIACPACDTHFANADDAVVTNLNPSEEYKTSILSGLSPNIIMECAGRALSFWAYQTTQEVIYQAYMGKTLTEKYSDLSLHLEKIVNEANTQISSMQNKLANINLDQDNLRQKNNELVQAYKEKNRKLLQTQELYDKLKRKAMLGQVQDAAESAVDSNLQASMEDDVGYSGLYEPQSNDLYNNPQTQTRPRLGGSSTTSVPHPATNRHRYNIASRLRPAVTQDVPFTPSTHRQRLGHNLGIDLSNIPGIIAGTPISSRNGAHFRPPPGNASTNPQRTYAKYPAVGLSSGLKASQSGNSFSDFAVPLPPTRTVDRPGSDTSNYSHRVVNTSGNPEPGHANRFQRL